MHSGSRVDQWCQKKKKISLLVSWWRNTSTKFNYGTLSSGSYRHWTAMAHGAWVQIK